MPLLRIIGEPDENVRDLARQLRERGFEVETVSDDANRSAADVEISLQECSAEEALSKALALANQAHENDISILVSPGTVLLPPDDSAEPARAADEFVPGPESETAVEFNSQALSQPDAGIEPEPEPVAAFQSNTEGVSDWPIWQVVREDGQFRPTPMKTEKSTNRDFATRFVALWTAGRQILSAPEVIRVLQNDRLFTRIAAAMTGIAVVLLLYGATADRYSPLPQGILERSRQAAQPAPFQKGSALPVSKADAQVGSRATTPTVVPHSVVPHSPLAGHGTVPSTPLATGKQMPNRRDLSSHEGDYIAKNTVVRYSQASLTGLPRSESKRPGIKYYTDLKVETR